MPLTLVCLPPDEASAYIARAAATMRWFEVGAGRLGYDGPGTDGWSDGSLSVVREADEAYPSASQIGGLYRQSGLDFVRGIPGSLAFVVYDAATQMLHATSSTVSRIRFAYWFRGDALVLSSRALEILRHPGAPRAVDDDYLAHVVTGYGAPPPGTTALRDVRRLLPGGVLSARPGAIELRQIDRLTPRVIPGADRSDWIRAFGADLDASVARARASGRACLSLSGGLDSALIGSALAQYPSATAAFSILAGGEVPDERAAIGELLQSYGSALEWHGVDCTSALTLRELDDLPLCDDPTLTPLTYVPARLRLWGRIRDSGFAVVLDGEGGDELFDRSLGAGDLVSAGEWPLAWSYLRRHTSRKSLVMRALVLPRAPARIQRAWAARMARRTPRLPTYLRSSAGGDPSIDGAVRRAYAQEIESSRAARFRQWLSSPFTAASWTAHRQLAGAYGLTLASPLLERPLVELALGLPARWAVSREPKPFLRAAAEDRVPDRIRTMPKDIAFPKAMLRRLVSAPEIRRALDDSRVRQRLERWVRIERVLGMLDGIAGGHPLEEGALWRQLEGLAAFAYWFERAANEYGVS